MKPKLGLYIVYVTIICLLCVYLAYKYKKKYNNNSLYLYANDNNKYF